MFAGPLIALLLTLPIRAAPDFRVDHLHSNATVAYTYTYIHIQQVDVFWALCGFPEKIRRKSTAAFATRSSPFRTSIFVRCAENKNGRFNVRCNPNVVLGERFRFYWGLFLIAYR